MVPGDEHYHLSTSQDVLYPLLVSFKGGFRRRKLRLIRLLSTAAPTTPPPKPEPPKLKRKTRSVKAAPPPPVEEAELEEDLEELDPVAAPLHDLDAPVTTALEASIRADLARYPDAILLTQVGSFFEVNHPSLSSRLFAAKGGLTFCSAVLLRSSTSCSSSTGYQTHFKTVWQEGIKDSTFVCWIPALATCEAHFHPGRRGP